VAASRHQARNSLNCTPSPLSERQAQRAEIKNSAPQCRRRTHGQPLARKQRFPCFEILPRRSLPPDLGESRPAEGGMHLVRRCRLQPRSSSAGDGCCGSGRVWRTASVSISRGSVVVFGRSHVNFSAIGSCTMVLFLFGLRGFPG